VVVHPVFTGADLSLYLAEAHVALTFPYRLRVTDQFWV
jgi:hypothetical protein